MKIYFSKAEINTPFPSIILETDHRMIMQEDQMGNTRNKNQTFKIILYKVHENLENSCMPYKHLLLITQKFSKEIFFKFYMGKFK